MDSLDRSLQDALDTIKAAFGHVLTLLNVTLILSRAGDTLTGAVSPGTTVGWTSLDRSEINADQLRLVVRGATSAGSATVQLYDVTHSAVLCSVTISGALPTVVSGDWTSASLTGGDSQLELRVLGDGIATQTLYAAHLQLRTSKFQP